MTKPRTPKKGGQPLGIMASFSKISFRKDGQELFSARVTSGGCFGPDPEAEVIDRGYAELNRAVSAGKAPATALDFNEVSVGAKDYVVESKTPTSVKARRIFGCD